MTRQVIAFTGVAGVGKSTLITTLATSIPFEHLKASSLIKEGRHASGETALTQDQLRLVDIDENQQFLVRGFRLKLGTTTRMIILDGHTVIEKDDSLTRIDPRVFGAIGIDRMIFLADDPEAINNRRRSDTTRKRPLPSVDRLRIIQEEARVHAVAICRALSVPLHVCHPDEPALIVHALQQERLGRE
jgi:adenylate kinase